ncbi:ABC transporter permease [Stratiformator vulcanicus]|uniref:ABC-2 family transporter protein n=1 Tax=Stratiformator vulcanicus TaxID=2527980 RepID=A0A517QZW9_9PLAN|nr:ABC-2 family transporter protein [Stratiformator vulcanicus]QDT37158.1 hypothetical protein Pan189_15300 [Stratiformator vulcanicus]
MKQSVVERPNYLSVWLTFLRNSAVREMTFRSNFIITVLTRAFYFAAQLTLFEIIYRNVPTIADWSRAEYFGFMATGMLINALVETFFMPNCANFSELIRKGDLDFVLTKPIDTQFLVSFEKVEIAMLNQVLLSVALLGYAINDLGQWDLFWTADGLLRIALYILLVGCGVTLFYSLMISLAATSVWFGRNQGLYDFWFYVTVFARYPRDIYQGGPLASILLVTFSYVIPILLAVTLPARVLMKSLESWPFIGISVLSAIIGVAVSRAIFIGSLRGYRSASS